jgi:uncharacterized protein with FMN-binding domain
MRRIVFAVMSTITAVVLLFSYHTSTNSAFVTSSPAGQLPTAPSPASPGPTSPGPASPGLASPAPSSSKSGSSTSKSGATGTYTGAAADTRWGPVQVRITVQGGKITASQAVQYPQNNGRDAQINGFALPVLNQEVLQAQSASIDTVSGATVTSDGYLQSLQSAIDQAHL